MLKGSITDTERCECGMYNCDGYAIHDLRLKGKKERATLAVVAKQDQREAALKERELAERERLADQRDQVRAERGENADAPTVGISLDDLTAVFEDEVDLTPIPALLERRHGDGGMVLPASKLNWLYGLPGSGKSFVGLITLHESVLRGGRAIYLDCEDSKTTFHQRAAILGFNPKDHADSFRYIHGGLAEYPVATAQALEWLAGAENPSMNCVVVDAAESSGCPSDGAQINDWLEKVVMPWRTVVDSGVNVLDHIPKSRERADGPIGSQRKMAAVDGISLLVGGYCWSKTKSGRITLINDKDRTGSYGKKESVGTIIGEWIGEGVARSFTYRIVESTKEDSANNNIGGEILKAVALAGPEGYNGKNNLGKAVGGNRNIVFQTIDALVEGGMLAVRKIGQSDHYTLTEEGLEYVD